MSLAVRETRDERMDDPALPPETYAAVLDDLARVNRLTWASRATLAFFARATRGRTHVRLLDVGFGQGDMLRLIARRAARRELAVDLIGVDLNPGSKAVAEALTPAELPIRYDTGDYRDQVGPFDLIVSSLVAHHMSAGELIAFLRFMDENARVGWLVNDVRRSALAHAGFPLLAAVMRWHPIVRADGRLSIARGYRAAEWQPLLAAAGVTEARIVRRFPFRLCVERLR